MENRSVKHKPQYILISLFCILWGFYLICVGYESAANQEWPNHMGPTLNAYLAAFRVFGPPLDAYLGAAFLIMVGLLFVIVPLYFQYSRLQDLKKPRDKNVEATESPSKD